MTEKLNDINNRSEALQEIMSKPPTWIIRWGIFIIFCILIMFIVACFFIRYPDIITANVIIKSNQPIFKMEATKSGTVDSIFVKNHDEVRKGQIIGSLKSVADFKDIMILKNLLEKVRYDSNSFHFSIDKSTNLKLGEIKSQYYLFARTYNEMKKNPKDTNKYIGLIQLYENLKASIANWEETYLLKSEMNGKIYFNQYFTKNQPIQSEDVLFSIFPTNEGNLYTVAIVPSQNIDKIYPFQKVRIKLANMPSQKFDIIQGKVKKVGLQADSNGNHHVEITLPKDFISSNNYHFRYNKEIYGSAEIVGEDLKLIDRILNKF